MREAVEVVVLQRPLLDRRGLWRKHCPGYPGVFDFERIADCIVAVEAEVEESDWRRAVQRRCHQLADAQPMTIVVDECRRGLPGVAENDPRRRILRIPVDPGYEPAIGTVDARQQATCGIGVALLAAAAEKQLGKVGAGASADEPIALVIVCPGREPVLGVGVCSVTSGDRNLSRYPARLALIA